MIVTLHIVLAMLGNFIALALTPRLGAPKILAASFVTLGIGGMIAALIADAQRRGANFGCDAMSGQIVPMDTAGILDAVGVAREALQTALSGAVMALTTEALVLHANPPTSYEP